MAVDEDPFDGEIYAIYLLQECQGQGLGRRLMKTAMEDMRARGWKTAYVWVLRDNPSSAFYERLGGQPHREETIEIGGVPLVECSYGYEL